MYQDGHDDSAYQAYKSREDRLRDLERERELYSSNYAADMPSWSPSKTFDHVNTDFADRQTYPAFPDLGEESSARRLGYGDNDTGYMRYGNESLTSGISKSTTAFVDMGAYNSRENHLAKSLKDHEISIKATARRDKEARAAMAAQKFANAEPPKPVKFKSKVP